MYKRNKYDYEFRLQCVEAVLKANRSLKAVAKEKGFDESNLRLWVRFYQTYGKSGLKPRMKRQYDTAFKLAVLEAMDKELLSLREACVRFNIPSESVIINWRKAYESKGQSGLIPQPSCSGYTHGDAGLTLTYGMLSNHKKLPVLFSRQALKLFFHGIF